MKKMMMALGVLVSLSLASCGEKLMTDDQVQAAIQEGVAAGRAAVEADMDKVCDANFNARVEAEFTKLKADYEASKAAMPSGK